MIESELKELQNIKEFNSIGYQHTIIYMARIHSQAEFLFTKVL